MSQSTHYVIPLKAPSPLPASGVNIVTFKVWKNTLVAHIQQDVNHHHFMPGGTYEVWTAAEFGNRITTLNDEDPDLISLNAKRARIGDEEYQREKNKLLTIRNAQLAKFITHIATLCHHTENDDVTNLSISLQWIFEYLKKHYGLETKGANFMNISDHVFKTGTPYQTFYKQYRASFIDNLRKTGDVVKYRNGYVLTEDEKLSPSFENAIILWALEKIDPRLPSKVKKNYGYQMTGDTTLKDIQSVIFENIHLMLEELDQANSVKAYSSQLLNSHQTNINSLTARNQKDKNKPASFKGKFNNKNKGFGSVKNASKNSSTEKFCRICNLAGSDARIYTSHEIGQCSRLSIRDLESLRNALVINGMITILEDEDEKDDDPSCSFQPGWDYEAENSSNEEPQ